MKNIFILFLLISNFVFTQNVDELFTEANSLYKDGEYSKAIELYNQIEVNGNISSELYYNLGNCYYKLNEVAPTIYNYEKALKIDPLNEDAQNNLVFAKRLTLDRIEALPKTVFQKFNENFLQKLTYNTWGIIAVMLSIIGSLLFLGYYFSNISSQKKGFFSTSMLSFILLAFTLLIAYNVYNTSQKNIEAIIFTEEVSINTEPTESSSEAFILHEGTKVSVLDQVDDWHKIRLADGKIGWVPSKHIKLLHLF
jgi:tetratricopeptide (TPR) repeat protein